MEKELRLKHYKVQKEFIPLYIKRKEEFLKCLTSGQIALLEFAQRKLRWIEERSTSDWREEVQNFKRKWWKVIFTEHRHLDTDYYYPHRATMTAKQILAGTGTTISIGDKRVPWLSFLNWSWWRARREWPTEKLVDRSLIKLKKLVDIGTNREILLIGFREEFLKLFPETEEVDILKVLAEIPQEIWKKIYWKSQNQFHPDKGGDQEVCNWLGKINQGIKVWRKWK